MTTLDDLARAERELREQFHYYCDDVETASVARHIERAANTIAAYIAAQRERDADNAKLRAELAQVAGYLETITAAKVELAADLGKAEAELAAAKAEVEQSDAEYQDAVTLAKSNLDRFQAAQAACGQMREALARSQSALREVGNDYPGSSCFTWCHARADEADAALSTDAGKGWIDATGAVEGRCRPVTHWEGYQTVIASAEVPAEWAGSTVLVVRKP